MADIAKKPIKITETILRDAHQSLIATRMTTEQMLPIIDKMDKVGYHSVECWGGATFDASLRFLKEDPWERLRKFRDGFKNTKLQMLFRGQNILGYRPYGDDVVEYFVQKSIANGIDIIRIFDCLNDLRNLQTAVTAANKEKGHAQVALSYTLGDAYTHEYWIDIAKRIEDMGANSICLKDMAGLLLPYEATELIGALKENVSIPIQLHTHYTSGVASMTYLKAVEAGVDVIDTAISPFALGTSQPATEVMVETFKGTPYDTGFDQNLLAEIADYFRPDTRKLPVIMLTARGSEYDTVIGLDNGADDYITKPFRMMELISRIRALLRRIEDTGSKEYKIENLFVSTGRHEVLVDKQPVSLTLKEYEMLCLLLKNSGTVLSRTQLLNQIWGYEFDGESRTVDVHIRTLRQKLGTAGNLVETVRGASYHFYKERF